MLLFSETRCTYLNDREFVIHMLCRDVIDWLLCTSVNCVLIFCFFPFTHCYLLFISSFVSCFCQLFIKEHNDDVAEYMSQLPLLGRCCITIDRRRNHFVIYHCQCVAVSVAANSWGNVTLLHCPMTARLASLFVSITMFRSTPPSRTNKADLIVPPSSHKKVVQFQQNLVFSYRSMSVTQVCQMTRYKCCSWA